MPRTRMRRENEAGCLKTESEAESAVLSVTQSKRPRLPLGQDAPQLTLDLHHMHDGLKVQPAGVKVHAGAPAE